MVVLCCDKEGCGGIAMLYGFVSFSQGCVEIVTAGSSASETGYGRLAVGGRAAGAV